MLVKLNERNIINANDILHVYKIDDYNSIIIVRTGFRYKLPTSRVMRIVEELKTKGLLFDASSIDKDASMNVVCDDIN